MALWKDWRLAGYGRAVQRNKRNPKTNCKGGGTVPAGKVGKLQAAKTTPGARSGGGEDAGDLVDFPSVFPLRAQASCPLSGFTLGPGS